MLEWNTSANKVQWEMNSVGNISVANQVSESEMTWDDHGSWQEGSEGSEGSQTLTVMAFPAPWNLIGLSDSSGMVWHRWLIIWFLSLRICIDIIYYIG